MEIATLLFPAFVNRTTRTAIVLVLTAALGLPLFSPVTAQEATPAPAVCDVQPRPITFIADLLAAPKPEGTPMPLTGVPEGTDVTDPNVREEVVSVVETLIVCVNQGEVLRAFALYSDEFALRVIDPEGFMTPEVAIEVGKALAKVEPSKSDDVIILNEVLLVRQLSTDTVAVVFRTRGGPDRDPDEEQTDLFVLRNDGVRWLIVDGLTDLDPESIPTPAA